MAVETYLYPNLVRFATSTDQYHVYEEIEKILELIDKFIKSNKKVDYENAVNHINSTFESIQNLSKKDGCSEQLIVDIIHDVLLLPCYILQYCGEKNDCELKIKYTN